ncbi:uncharacterized protein [Mobula birostris]|uniref:uncharacterized protein isoform X1 n=1 Tax=Mobula birostris TaxID=1983395 RepID=UPI003B2871E3
MALQRDRCRPAFVFLLGSLLSWSAMAFKAEVQDEICCKKFFAMKWRRSAFGEFSLNYRTLSHCNKPQLALRVVHKRRGYLCLNFDLLWVKDLKEYIDKVRKSASPPAAEKRLGNNPPTTTEAHLRSLHSTADWDSSRPTETTPGSTGTPTWTLLDRMPVTVTSDQSPGVKLPTPVVETSVGISPAFPGPTHSSGKARWNSGSEVPHASSTVPLTSPSLAAGGISKEGSLENRAFSTVNSLEIPERQIGQLNQKMMLAIVLITTIFVPSLLSFVIYKRCKKSSSTGFNYYPTQTRNETGVTEVA